MTHFCYQNHTKGQFYVSDFKELFCVYINLVCSFYFLSKHNVSNHYFEKMAMKPEKSKIYKVTPRQSTYDITQNKL